MGRQRRLPKWSQHVRGQLTSVRLRKLYQDLKPRNPKQRLSHWLSRMVAISLTQSRSSPELVSWAQLMNSGFRNFDQDLRRWWISRHPMKEQNGGSFCLQKLRSWRKWSLMLAIGRGLAADVGNHVQQLWTCLVNWRLLPLKVKRFSKWLERRILVAMRQSISSQSWTLGLYCLCVISD